MVSTPRTYGMNSNDEKKLEGGRPLYTIALRKEWAKKPTYWLSLFTVTKASVVFLYLVRSWKWPREGEIIQGSILSQRFTARNVALEAAREMLYSLQDEKEYRIDNVVADPADLVPAENAWLEATGKWSGGQKVTWSGGQEVKSSTPSDSESKNFEQLQKKRKGKAYW